MNPETPPISSSRNPSQVRRVFLSNNPTSGQDARLLLQASLKVKSHLLVIRRSAVGEQAKLLEIIDQVGDVCYHPPCQAQWRRADCFG